MRRRWLDAGLVLGVVAIAIAAVVSGGAGREAAPAPTPDGEPPPSVSVDEETVPEELPSLLPLPGELREEGGVLWWASADCEAGSIDLSSGAVAPRLAGRCRLWPEPGGRAVAAVTRPGLEAQSDPGLVLLGAGESQGTAVEHTPGFLGAELAWSPDGSVLAACFGTPKGTIVDLLPDGGSLRGACFPAWLADGRLAVARSSPASVEIEGEPFLTSKDIARLLPTVPGGSRRAVSALAGGSHRLAAAFIAVSDGPAPPTDAALAVISETGGMEFTANLPPDRLPAAIGLSPDASALWYFEAVSGNAILLKIPGGQRREPYDASWFTWSPSGRYLAAATERGIVVEGWPDGEEIARLPVRARDVSWVLKPPG